MAVVRVLGWCFSDGAVDGWFCSGGLLRPTGLEFAEERRPPQKAASTKAETV